MSSQLKRVPSVDGLRINKDGTAIYYKGKIKNVHTTKKDGKKYKRVCFDCKTMSVAKLVYEAYIGPVPQNRNMKYIDGNTLNTDYTNLGPKPFKLSDSVQMRKVKGYDELYINSNGTIVVQNGYEINIQAVCTSPRTVYHMCVVSTAEGNKRVYIHTLVLNAWLGKSKKFICVHKYGNTKDNFYKNLLALTPKQYKKHSKIQLKHIQLSRSHKSRSIPESDTNIVKQRLKDGEPLNVIAKQYGCSDMSVHRFKKMHFTEEEIREINAKNNKNNPPTPKHVVRAVVICLKEGQRQADVARRFALSPYVVCRINKKYIREANKN